MTKNSFLSNRSSYLATPGGNILCRKPIDEIDNVTSNNSNNTRIGEDSEYKMRNVNTTPGEEKNIVIKSESKKESELKKNKEIVLSKIGQFMQDRILKPNFDRINEDNKRNPEIVGKLIEAIKKNHTSLVEALLKGGVDPNVKIDGQEPVLIIAIKELNIGIVELLIDNGVDVKAKDENNNVSIDLAYQIYSSKTDFFTEKSRAKKIVNLLKSSFNEELVTQEALGTKTETESEIPPTSVNARRTVELRNMKKQSGLDCSIQ